MTNPPRVPKGINPHIPNAARMYDYYLGGKDNFAADRAAAEKIMALGPSREICLANRRFLGRAVRQVAGLGIDQFIDLGTGLPNQNNGARGRPARSTRTRTSSTSTTTPW
ncbi:hypothetical protein GCM10020220_091890 [Nonomuraea rubra]|uniref:SAM-dependent methyltransferase n=1 Tax=Nonomuraea rubra TaxID=46180 RepID=UPI0031EDD584